VKDYDVLVVGYGPTGMVAAALLGMSGHRVGVIERYEGLFNLPRAATFDDETMRLFQKLGIADSVAVGTRPQRTYDWVNAEGQILIRNEFELTGIHGWPEFNMMFQPVVEAELDQLCRSIPTIDILYGHTLSGFSQREEAVEAAVSLADGTADVVKAPYLIGCDGGNSTVRRLLGVAMDDYGFQEPWLVCDFLLKRPVDLPMAQQYGDPDQPTSIVSIGPNHHRFSFMLDAEVANVEDVSADEVWQRVQRWISPDDADLVRVAPYMFRSTVAQSWCDRRVFLAGDAAHQMPPFLGQGMCSGIRDAHNLAWKLDVVLSGRSGADILSTYEPERSPHVRAIVEKAVELGRVQTVRGRDAAEARDRELIRRRESGVKPDAFRFPSLTSGLLSAAGDHARARGTLLPQLAVSDAVGERRLFDDVAGGGFVLLLRGSTLTDDLSEITQTALPGSDLQVVNDTDGLYQDWFDANLCDAALVRPDWYVYGTASSPASTRLLLENLTISLGTGRQPHPDQPAQGSPKNV
jgi:2-polyprenyl-6-methoxyphenol hydroxylase-like FAD-dependent oxidoreductase